MAIAFDKMHGAGNDFVILDAVTQELRLSNELICRLADRRRGIGCDQVLVLEPARNGGDFAYKIYNPDGSAAEQCGNGIRCLAQLAVRRGLTVQRSLRFEAPTTTVQTQLLDDGAVQVSMGTPSFEPRDIPLARAPRAAFYTQQFADHCVEFSAVSIGNPHAVIQVADIGAAAVATLGPLLQQQGLFPRGVNVGFMQILSKQHVALRVYERGAGETQACGSGACAAAVVGIHQQLLTSPVTVELPGGSLSIDWAGEGEQIWMTGPTEHVFAGHFKP